MDRQSVPLQSVAASKRRVFDRTPGRAAAEVKPPRVFSVPPRAEKLERIDVPEPYALGQRVQVRGTLGTVFNVCPCSCTKALHYLGRFVYVIELSERQWGSWFYMGHSSEVNPV